MFFELARVSFEFLPVFGGERVVEDSIVRVERGDECDGFGGFGGTVFFVFVIVIAAVADCAGEGAAWRY